MRICGPEILPTYSKSPEFRKASHAMTLASTALRGIFEDVPTAAYPEIAHHLGLVVGSSHGELEVTAQFLEHIGNQNIARPLLFQNSLHNSTLGFLTVKYDIRGAAMTVSHGVFSGEDALDCATTLLRSGESELCLALSYDIWIPRLEGVRDYFYPAGLKRGGGAAAVLLATGAGMRLLPDQIEPIAELVDIEKQHLLDESVIVDISKVPQPHYDGNAIEQLALFLNSNAQSNSQPDHLTLHKPDGRKSRILVRRL